MRQRLNFAQIDALLRHSALNTANSDSTVTEKTALCSDCPPVGYPTDITRCDECPRKTPVVLTDVVLPTYCGCNELLENIEQLENPRGARVLEESMFGVVTFSNENGPIKRVECATEADYFRELNIGARWADSEPHRPLSVHGERMEAQHDQS